MQNSYFTPCLKDFYHTRYQFIRALNLILIIIFSYLFTSCSNDIVTVDNPGYDSARYNWEIDTVEGIHFWDAVYFDTNKIYYLSQNALYEYNGIDYLPHFYGYPFTGYCISAIDENNIYTGGYSMISYNQSMAYLKKWNGAGFEEFIIADTSDKADNFYSIYSKSIDEHWLSATKGRVYKFDGNNFMKYQFDTNSWYIDPFVKDAAGSIYFENRVGPKLDMHKYNGTSWQTLCTVNLTSSYFRMENIGNQIFNIHGDNIQFFNGSGFTDFLYVGDFLIMDLELCGSSPQNIFLSGFGFGDHKDYIFNYNGNKWSKEIEEDEDYENYHYFYSTSNTVYAIAYDFNTEKTIVIKGVRK